MNSSLRIRLILCIAFGICFGHLLLDLVEMTVKTLITPNIQTLLGKVFAGLDSQYLQIGTFISGAIPICITAGLLWFVWRRFAEPRLGKDNAP